MRCKLPCNNNWNVCMCSDFSINYQPTFLEINTVAIPLPYRKFCSFTFILINLTKISIWNRFKLPYKISLWSITHEISSIRQFISTWYCKTIIITIGWKYDFSIHHFELCSQHCHSKHIFICINSLSLLIKTFHRARKIFWKRCVAWYFLLTYNSHYRHCFIIINKFLYCAKLYEVNLMPIRYNWSFWMLTCWCYFFLHQLALQSSPSPSNAYL